MVEGVEANGRGHSGPPFAMCGKDFSVLPASKIVELLEVNARAKGAVNLSLGPIFREAADDFREWSRTAEPGMFFQAPEIRLKVVRLSMYAATATFLSSAAQKKMADEGDATPRIATG